ncbi:PorV/PorQ family protein [bacterium]|nr:PorV/PorQ family protein [bacterium]MBU2462031.1 PorV/PorQ family protein [bacterium]
MRRIFVFLGVMAIATTGFAKDKGETASAFLKLGAGARAAGMGDAYCSVADDATAVYWNPAGLSRVEEKEGTFMFLRPMTAVPDLAMSYIGLAIPATYGKFGGAITYYGYGEMDEITGEKDGNPVKNKTWEAYDFACSFSFAKDVNKDTALGATLKIVNGKIAESSAIAFACDFGLLHKTKGLAIGAVIKNVGSSMEYEKEGFDLPLSVKTGVSYKLLKLPLLLSSDLTFPNDNKTHLNFGAEYSSREIFSLRCGYKSGPENEGKGFTLGAGMKPGLYSFDYAYQTFAKLGDAHRISLSAKF